MAGRPRFGGSVTPGSDKPTLCRPQSDTDRLDPELIAIQIDVSDHLVVGRSSSAAKKADAVFKISLALRSSAFSFFKRRISACSSLLTPGRLPASTSARMNQRRNVSNTGTKPRMLQNSASVIAMIINCSSQHGLHRQSDTPDRADRTHIHGNPC